MNARKPRIGLLPLYLELYDRSGRERRTSFAPFLEAVRARFAAGQVDVVSADICCVSDEFGAALALFTDRDVDAIVTVHLAYSPSLESVRHLAASPLPIIILDTTMDAGFGRDVEPARIMYNHGIHGVMDMASMLRRLGKPYAIVAGHVTDSNVVHRAADLARAAYGARCLKTTRALRIGAAFRGMGDFDVAETVMARGLGLTVDQLAPDDLAPAVLALTPDDIRRELERDAAQYNLQLPADVHERSVRVGLGLRKTLESGDYTAFSMNFLAFDKTEGGVDTVPFLEASKAMARGLGYAGEGDVLTASLVGALNRAFGRTTFTEIFCPDWKGNSLFLSHMGEINPAVAAAKPDVVEKPFPYTPACNPAVLVCAPAPGPAVFVNLAPGPNDTFSLILCPVDVLEDTSRADLRRHIRAWIRPSRPIAELLESYSRQGGTHHSALVLGHHLEALKSFASFAALECIVL